LNHNSDHLAWQEVFVKTRYEGQRRGGVRHAVHGKGNYQAPQDR
jgi:hypothetical protein